jgi:hypothetical protein
MDEYETLNLTTWDCKCHVVFIPKYRRKMLFRELRKPWMRFFVNSRLRKKRKLKGICFRTVFTCCCRSRQNTRFRTWSGISRERARTIWRGPTANESAISSGKASGRAVIS